MRNITISAVQLKCSANRNENIENAEHLVRKAKKEGADIVLLPELFETPYFCQERKYEYYALASEVYENSAVKRFMKTAKELEICIPVSFYERHINNIYNSVAMINEKGEISGIYRKTHIPDDHCYQEKFYFTPGDTGFKVFDTRKGKVGIGICWDQWFPETARCLALLGAEIILYPTAIGSEPILECDSMPHWRRCMQGHSAANIVPIAAANRVGQENVAADKENGGQSSSILFYGSSFITNETGEIINSADRESTCVLTNTFDLDKIAEERFNWGLFRDRRPEMYREITK